MSISELIQQILPIYFLLIAGLLARLVKLTKSESDDYVLQLMFNVLYPCFILDKILGNTGVRDVKNIVWGFSTGFILVSLGFLVAWWAAGLIGFQRGKGKRTFTLSAGVQNYGYTAIPIIEQLFGGAMAMLFVHNLGAEFAIWSIGIMIISGDNNIPWRRLINGPTIAVIISLSLVLTNLDYKVTGSVRTTISWLGAGAIPIGVFVTGSIIMDLIGKERPNWKTIGGSTIVRLGILSALILAVAKWVPMPLILKQVLLVQSAMPAAMAPLLLAKLYNGKPAVALEIIVATTTISLITIPFVLIFGRWWLGI